MNSPLITAEQLKNQIGKGVVIIDCRFNLMDKDLGYQQYRVGHVPGAYYFHLERDLSAPVSRHGGRHPLPATDILADKLRRAGINQQTLVVVYDDSRMAFAARAWWLLRHLGHEHVAILDGGYQAWCALGGMQDRREPPARWGTFRVRAVREDTVDYADILANPDALTLIDAREPRRYAGLEEPIDPVAGHIPGAVNFPWQDATDEQGFFKPAEWHEARWQSLPDKRNLAVYCGSGVTACVNILSLYISGIEARLYPGSWSDWCSYQTTQISNI